MLWVFCWITRQQRWYVSMKMYFFCNLKCTQVLVFRYRSKETFIWLTTWIQVQFLIQSHCKYYSKMNSMFHFIIWNINLSFNVDYQRNKSGKKRNFIALVSFMVHPCVDLYKSFKSSRFLSCLKALK